MATLAPPGTPAPDRATNILATYRARLRLFSPNIRLFLLGTLLSGLGMTCFQLLFNLYVKRWGRDVLGIGDEGRIRALFAGANAMTQIGAAAAALLAAYVIARTRHKVVLVAAQGMSALLFMAAMAVNAAPPLYGLLFAAGAFSVFNRVLSGPFAMANTTPRERPYVFSFQFIILLSGGVVGHLLGGTIKDAAVGIGVPEITGYRLVIAGGCALSLLGVIPFLFLRSRPAAEPDASAPRPAGLKGLDWRFYARALTPVIVLGTGAGLIVQFINAYLKDAFRLADSHIGYIMAGVSATMVLGLLAAPMLSERFGKVKTIVATQLLSIPFMLALVFTRDLRVAIAALVFRAALMNMGGPITNNLMFELCRKEEQSVLSALFTTSWTASWAAAAWIFGRIGDYQLSFLIAVGLYLASTCLFAALFRGADAAVAARQIDGEQVESGVGPR